MRAFAIILLVSAAAFTHATSEPEAEKQTKIETTKEVKIESEKIESSGIESSGIEASGEAVIEENMLWSIMDQAMNGGALLERSRRSLATEDSSSGIEASGSTIESSGDVTITTQIEEGIETSERLPRGARVARATSDAESSGALETSVLSEKTEAETENTTDAVTTTTTAPVSECKPVAKCGSDDDCFGGNCIGAFVGKCKCMSCLSFLPCTSDAQCGGLQGGCNATVGHCKCNEAIMEATQFSLAKVTLSFCNVKECSKNECLGLPCWEGFCACPKKDEKKDDKKKESKKEKKEKKEKKN